MPPRRRRNPRDLYIHALKKGLVKPKPSIAAVRRGNAFYMPKGTEHEDKTRAFLDERSGGLDVDEGPE